jgi:hypothetical protein
VIRILNEALIFQSGDERVLKVNIETRDLIWIHKCLVEGEPSQSEHSLVKGRCVPYGSECYITDMILGADVQIISLLICESFIHFRIIHDVIR